jgi:thiol-disulfide isomerase/thioredoxin
MLLRRTPPTKLIRIPITTLPATRPFSLLNPTQRSHTNRIFDPIRAADNRTLITLWSAKWCQTCQTVKPLILRLLEEEKLGEREGGLGFAEVEMDSTLIEDLPIVYRVCIATEWDE